MSPTIRSIIVDNNTPGRYKLSLDGITIQKEALLGVMLYNLIDDIIEEYNLQWEESNNKTMLLLVRGNGLVLFLLNVCYVVHFVIKKNR